MARWTRVKRLRGGRSHMDSQMCLSKKPHCSSATRRRRKRRRAAAPGERTREGFRRPQAQGHPAGHWGGDGLGPYLPPAPPSPRGRRWPPCPLTTSR